MRSQTGRYNSRHFHFSPWLDQSGGRQNATGSVENNKVRAVCNECNNGWMSLLEVHARPFLQPLVEGTPIVLDREQMALVAQWITMKVMVVEHALPNNAVTTRYHREMFRARREIPYFFRIYLANHDVEPVAALRRDARCMAFNAINPDPPLGGESKNVQSVAIVLGRVFALIHAARIYNFNIEDRVRFPDLYGTSRIWPPDHFELVWPHDPIFSLEQLENMSAVFEHLDKTITLGWMKDLPK